MLGLGSPQDKQTGRWGLTGGTRASWNPAQAGALKDNQAPDLVMKVACRSQGPVLQLHTHLAQESGAGEGLGRRSCSRPRCGLTAVRRVSGRAVAQVHSKWRPPSSAFKSPTTLSTAHFNQGHTGVGILGTSVQPSQADTLIKPPPHPVIIAKNIPVILTK